MPYQPTVDRNWNAKMIMALGQEFRANMARQGQSLSNTLNKIFEDRKREGQEADKLRSLLSHVDKDNADLYKTMSLSNLRGTAEGMALKNAMAKAREEENKRTNMAAYNADVAKLFAEQQVPRQGPVRPGFDPGYATVKPTVTVQDIAAAAARNKVLDQNLTETLMRNQQGFAGGPSLQFQSDAETGSRFAMFGNTMVPTPIQPQPDQTEGAPPGYVRVPMPNGKWGYMQDKSAGSDKMRMRLGELQNRKATFEGMIVEAINKGDKSAEASYKNALAGIVKEIESLSAPAPATAPSTNSPVRVLSIEPTTRSQVW